MTKREILIATIKAAKTASLGTMILLAIYSYFADMPSDMYIYLGIVTVAFFILQFVHKRLVQS